MADPVVTAENLRKVYRTAPGTRVRRGAPGREVVALDGVSFEARGGEVYGVLGPNGAGKTTLMKVLATVLIPDAGSVRILGLDASRDAPKLRKHIGIALGEYERTFHWRLTGRQNLRFFADFYAIPRADLARRVDEAMGLVGLGDLADRMYLEYSTGQKHRLALARGLLPDPELLLLDEPTAGLDLASSLQLGERVRDIAARGKTVLYTTHRLHEAARLCHRVMILREGRVVAEESPRELLKLAEQRRVVRVKAPGLTPEKLAEVRGLPDVAAAFLDGHELRLHVASDEADLHGLLGELKRLGIAVTDVNTDAPDITDVYLKLTEAR